MYYTTQVSAKQAMVKILRKTLSKNIETYFLSPETNIPYGIGQSKYDFFTGSPNFGILLTNKSEKCDCITGN